MILNCKKQAGQRSEIPVPSKDQSFDSQKQSNVEGNRPPSSEPLGQIVNEDTVLQSLKEGLSQKRNISTALQNIPKNFFENKSQMRAKTFFSKAMNELFGATVYFPQAGPLEGFKPQTTEKLDLNVFQVSATQGVENDIPNSSKDRQRIHVYQVASQYNAAEAAGPYTPPIGTAMESSKGDKTQGPLAQRTNPAAFECVTAFLTHLGFNMLHEALPSAGQTYQHGYLRPTDETIENLTQEFKENFAHAEYVCYSSLSDSWGGSQPVYLMLQAAPAIGYAKGGLSSSSDELQKYAALANYLALFRQGIVLAKERGKPVVLHAAAVGGGVFGNKDENLQWGFCQATLALQGEMKSLGVSVQL
jgi:hypothetical protein